MPADLAHRRAALSLGYHLLPQDKILNDAYWIEHWPLINNLTVFSAVLDERRHYFAKTRSRADAWSLIMATDLVWQTIRTLSGKKGSDRQWLDAYLPANHRILFPEGSALTFAPIEQLVDNVLWVYELNSVMRHPGTNAQRLSELIQDPWDDDTALRLDQGAEAAGGILVSFDVALSPGNGFPSEIDAKDALAELAANHWRSKF